MTEVYQTPDWIRRTQVVLDSYRKWLGKELVPRDGDVQTQAERLFEADFVVVAHGTEEDPILNYGNRTALKLWEMDLERFLQTPSRLTAEPMHRDERAELLEQTRRQGYCADYRGIRISARGRRFRIHRATVWNLVEGGKPAGQAATFAEWEFLPE